MKQKIVFADIRKLVQHERINPAHLRAVRKEIRRDGAIRRPVIVDRESRVILDGHHRVQALRELGAKRVPVVYVRYQDAHIRVYLRRKDMFMKFIKRMVVETATSHVLFPSKTTRHLITRRPVMKMVPISKLL